MHCGLVDCLGGNATDPIWRVLASSDRIPSWTPLKPQHSNPNPLANQLWCIDFLTPPTPLIILHRLPAFLESFIACRSSKVSDSIFEIHQLWQSGFSRVYSNCCSNCSFEPEIIKMSQSSHKIHSNNILNFQETTAILDAHTKKVWKLIVFTSYIYIYIYIYHHHHHHIALVARISLTLSRHSSLSFIALGRSSGQHPVSSHSCWMYVRAGRPAFARPCVGIHKSTSLMSSSLLLQQCPVWFV